jgi:hypothetical protein
MKACPRKPPADTMFMAAMAMDFLGKITEEFGKKKNTKL